MKNQLLLTVLITMLSAACTNENNESSTSAEQTSQEGKSLKQTQKLHRFNPANTANIYDIAGQLHNEILDAYLTGGHSCSTIAEIIHQVDSISASSSEFLSLESNLPISVIEIQEIVDNPQTVLDETIANSPMSNDAKTCLSNFMSSLNVWEDNEYEIIHQFIISFETAVINNPQFNSEDKRIILTTSSIMRYSQYYSKERKDKDWETSVGNRVGAVKGAIGNCSTAINTSIVTGLINYSIQIP